MADTIYVVMTSGRAYQAFKNYAAARAKAKLLNGTIAIVPLYDENEVKESNWSYNDTSNLQGQ